MAASVWVVEQLGGDDEWRPVDLVVAGVSREMKMHAWRESFPARRYRLTRYVSTRAERGRRG